MPIAKRYQFTSNASLSSSNLNTNFDDIINAFNSHTHTGIGTDAPLITSSGIGNGFVPGSNPYKFFAYHNTTQTPANNAIVAFNTELYDTANNFSSNRFTAPVTGYYQFFAATYVQSVSTFIQCYFKMNNTTLYNAASGYPAAGSDVTLTASIPPVAMVAGDYMEVFRSYNTGGAPTIFGVAGIMYTYFGGYLVTI